MSNSMSTEERARLATERRTLRKTLNDLGATGFTIAVTIRRAGRPIAWASLPFNDEHAALRSTLIAAGFVVRTETYTIAVLTGETA